jgi:peptidyl-prolyl cis-trans isomerase SurA
MLALLLASAALAAAEPRSPRVVDRVAAVVNGEVVTMLELEDRAAGDLRRAAAEPAVERERARVRALKLALDGAISERLLDGQAAALGVEVTDQEIDAVVEDVKRRNGLDDARLDEALAAQGIADRAAYRKSVRSDLETWKVLQLKVRSRVKVTDEDVKNYWQTHPQEFQSGEEIRVRHIFLSLAHDAPAADVERTRARAEKVRARLRAGEDFAKVAREVSQGPSAAEGGELGWLKRGTVQPEVEKVAFALRPGEVSEPVRTRAGYQILRVEERRGGGARPLEEVKDEIRDRLMNEQIETYRNQFVTELRKDALVEVKLPELRD